MLRKESQMTRLDHLLRIKKQGYKRVAKELKQRIKAKDVFLKRYKNRVKQYRQNRLFQSNQSKFYQELVTWEEYQIRKKLESSGLEYGRKM